MNVLSDYSLNRLSMSSSVISANGESKRLVKHSDARDASLEGVVAALHAIADAFG